MSFLQTLAQPQVFPWVCGVLGLAVGSFLNVVVYRLPKMMEREWALQYADMQADAGSAAQGGSSAEAQAAVPAEPTFNLATPASRCPACGHRITALENIPVISWLALRGRCSACKVRISARYPAVELAASAAAAYSAWQFGAGVPAFGAMVFVWAILAAGLIDFDTQFLPDSITLPLLWLGLLLNIGANFAPLDTAVIGAAAGYLSLWSVYWLFKLATGKEGMGFGDFKLLAAIGAWMGWTMLPMVILLSSVVGAVVGIGLIVLARHGRDVPIPFGPYLGAAGIIAMFWGKPINIMLMSRFGFL